jgi:hypothetical protein
MVSPGDLLRDGLVGIHVLLAQIEDPDIGGSDGGVLGELIEEETGGGVVLGRDLDGDERRLLKDFGFGLLQSHACVRNARTVPDICYTEFWPNVEGRMLCAESED